MSRKQYVYDVFLSHSSADKKLVKRIAEKLRADGVRVFFDEAEIGAGRDFVSLIEEGLSNSRMLLACVSENWGRSEWAKQEYRFFVAKDPGNTTGCIIPLRLDETVMTGFLSTLHYIDWRTDRDHAYSRLLGAIRGTSEVHDDDTSTSEEIVIGRVYNAVVTSITTFGLFIEIIPGIEALLHVSEIPKAQAAHIQDVFTKGERIRVRVLSIDHKGRIRVSHKAAL